MVLDDRSTHNSKSRTVSHAPPAKGHQPMSGITVSCLPLSAPTPVLVGALFFFPAHLKARPLGMAIRGYRKHHTQHL